MCFFSVDTAEYAVVTQFGRPVQVITEPGLGVKLPYQSVNKFDNRLFVYAPPPSEFLTLEKTAVAASGVILWRIAEPRKFFETVFDRVGAEARLSDILSHRGRAGPQSRRRKGLHRKVQPERRQRGDSQ